MKTNYYQKLFLHLLTKIREGHLVVKLPDGSHRFFGTKSDRTTPIHLEIHDSEFFKRLILQEDIGLGESYILKEWNCSDVTGLLKLLIRNQRYFSSNKSDIPARVVRTFLLGWERLMHLARNNNRKNSRKNIHAHYDLGNDFYKLFLDPTMTYSAGFFFDKEQDLESAQFEKYDRLCRKLALKPHHHLLEIGSGWGGLAVHAATHFGVKVTTVTISEEQYAYAKNLIAEKGLEDRIDIRFQDYRDIHGTFDRIVSIEMLEAVGHEHLNRYFKTCQRLLAPDGIFAFQVILSPDSRYLKYRNRVDYIRKHIFPGGHLPSVESIHKAVNKCSEWDLLHMETFGTHYAETLRRWDANFAKSTEQRRSLGFDEAFDRKWEFYFRYCEAGFDTRHIQVAQFVYAAPNNPYYEFDFDAARQQERSENQGNIHAVETQQKSSS